MSKQGFWKYFRANLRFAAMITTLSFSSVALTTVAYEFVTNEENLRKELQDAKDSFSLIDNFQLGATRPQDNAMTSSTSSERLRARQNQPPVSSDTIKAQIEQTIKTFTSDTSSESADKEGKK